MKKKKVISISLVAILVVGGAFITKSYLAKSELVGKFSIFGSYDNSSNIDEIREEILSLKEIEGQKDSEAKENNKNIENIIVNEPVVEIKENKKEITKEEILQKVETNEEIEETNEIIQSVSENQNEIGIFSLTKEKFVKLQENETVIANMEAMMFALVPTEWFFSNSKIVIDSDGIDESTEYITFEELSQEVLKNKKSGNIKIFAYDEIWNNGKDDYVRTTRCYVR